MHPGRYLHAGVLLPVVLAAAAHAGGRRAPDAAADREIRALIEALGRSECRFERNGRWYDAGRAQAHLQRKYDWARRRGLEGDAERFIRDAASRSSRSGRAYRVDCPGEEAPCEAEGWFRERLEAMRSSGSPR